MKKESKLTVLLRNLKLDISIITGDIAIFVLKLIAKILGTDSIDEDDDKKEDK